MQTASHPLLESLNKHYDVPHAKGIFVKILLQLGLNYVIQNIELLANGQIDVFLLSSLYQKPRFSRYSNNK